MSTKLALIDLDGVIANADARFERAKNFADQEAQRRPLPRNDYQEIYWRAVFDPQAALSLDTLIDGVNDALMDVQDEGYQLVIFTSRPVSMLHATLEWLLTFTVFDDDDRLVMKPPAFQYVKTPIWKAGMVHTLTALYEPSQVLFVDDEPNNQNEVLKYAGQLGCELLTASSLPDALAKIHGEVGVTSDDPTGGPA